MKNISEFLQDAISFQDFASERGRELLMALGCEFEVYKTPDSFKFQDDGVEMCFAEKTGHDCPSYETVSLKIADLEKTNEDWIFYVEECKKKTLEKQERLKEEQAKRKLADKERQFELLKKELGKC